MQQAHAHRHLECQFGQRPARDRARWFSEAAPDVACLQEIKCVDEKFPTEAFESLGYNVAVHGQKSYNGVALFSKSPMEDVRRGLPGDDGDDHARYIEAVISAARPVRVASIYLPNGNPVGTEKFAYKLAWLERLAVHARELLALEERLVLAGDYNVIPGRPTARTRPPGRTTPCSSPKAARPSAGCSGWA